MINPSWFAGFGLCCVYPGLMIFMGWWIGSGHWRETWDTIIQRGRRDQ